MAGFNIDYDRYAEISDKIDFAPEICSDGLCCFLTPNHIQSYHIRSDFTMGLVDVKKPAKAKDIKEFLENFFLKNISEDKACQYLKARAEIREGRLNLQFRCRLYGEARPTPECYDYPEDNKRCKFHDRQIKHAKEREYTFYSFSKEHFPQLEEFSCGRMTNVLEGEFFLVPVPLFSKVPEVFTPYDLAQEKIISVPKETS